MACYILPGHAGNVSDSLVDEVKLKISQEQGTAVTAPVVLHSSSSLFNRLQGETICDFYLGLYRKHLLHRNERLTVLSKGDQLIALQLVLAEKQKDTIGEFDIENRSVVEAEKLVVSTKLDLENGKFKLTPQEVKIFERYENFLERGNYADWSDIYTAVAKEINQNEALLSEFQQRNYLVVIEKSLKQEEIKMMELLCQFCSCHEVQIKETSQSLDESFKQDSHITQRNLTSIIEDLHKRDNYDENNFTSPQKSATEGFIHNAVLSYLELLVNSRSELALARVINLPDRGLDHEAFTDLKRYAKSLNMPMYQAAMSFITRLRLGGKRYVPKSSCVLAQHVKGIGEFSDLMQRIHTVVEEDPNTGSACKRVVNMLKVAFLKDKENRLRRSSIEASIETIQKTFTELIDSLDLTSLETPDKPTGCGGSVLGRQTVKVIRKVLDREATHCTSSTSVFGDIISSQKTPVHFPCLLSKFRSPVEQVIEDCDRSLEERMKIKIKKTIKPKNKQSTYKSDMDWALPLYSPNRSDVPDFIGNTQVIVIPSKTLVQPRENAILAPRVTNTVTESLNDQENVPSIKASKSAPLVSKVSDTRSKAKVRPAPSETDDNCSETLPSQPPTKKQKVPLTKSKKTARRKLIPQIKGQQSLTKFFRV